MSIFQPLLRATLWLTLLGLSVAIAIFMGALLYLGPKLPQVEQILDIQLQTPLRIYSSEEKLIAEFGEKKRSPIHFNEIPKQFIHAVLAAEDARFFSHPGVDIKGLSRAVLELVSTGSIQTGGSTITMQVAKNYFLSRERTFLRKFNEILLSLDMERKLTKAQIMELYLNKIPLGHRAYGIKAAAQVYYGKPLEELTIAQLATIAGLPKAPSAMNPITNPERSMVRRNWILSRMRDLGYIDQQTMDEATAEPNTAELHGIPVEVDAPYFAEMVRRDMVKRFGETADTAGYRVYTTLKAENQTAANTSLQKGLIAYDKRHGYRGEEAKIELDPEALDETQLVEELKRFRTIGPLQPALVLSTEDTKAQVLLESGEAVSLTLESIKWARRYIDNVDRGPEPKSVSEVLEPGHIIRVVKEEDDSWSLAQKPIAQSALISLSPQDGSILALVGGFDFRSSKFNRATQGERQTGSSFKPFIYGTALSRGMTAATVINDAPVVLEDSRLEATWRPENSGGRFHGPTRLRQALYRSRNLVSIRVLQRMGFRPTINYAKKFGFDGDKLPTNLSLALGAAEMTPQQLTTAYAILANGGYKVEPWYIKRIEDENGEEVFSANPIRVCDDSCQRLAEQEKKAQQLAFAELLKQEQENQGRELEAADPKQGDQAEEALPPPRYAERVQDERINFLLTSMMQDVIKRGTGVKARSLNRSDLAGKTGTTNDQKDAWFAGFNRDVVTTVWVGFDQPRNLGRREYGGTAALPIWIDYMAVALKDSPQLPMRIPDGIVTVKIDPESGERAKPGQTNAVFEYFRQENAPAIEVMDETPNPQLTEDTLPEQLF